MSSTEVTPINSVLDKLQNLSSRIKEKPLSAECTACLKDLLLAIAHSLSEINELLHRPETKTRVGRIKLCTSQIYKTLPALVNEVAYNKVRNIDIVAVLIERLHCCVKEIVSMTEEDSEPDGGLTTGNFVQFMDSAIGLLKSDRYADEGYKLLVEDLLCQALTIAKLSCAQDYNEITSSCKNVLSALSTLLDDKCGVSFYKDYLMSTLEVMERKVNVAVLKLALHSFSEPFVILKGLVKKCRETYASSTERCVSDLDEMISCFDLYCDHVHLIGNFAVACSDNNKVILAVESCLASLDFCEKYLVLAITSFYLDPSNIRKRTYLKFFVDCWHSELLALNLLLDDIIDTAAFIQVAQEDLHESINKIKSALTSGDGVKEAVSIFVKRGRKVIEHVKRSPEEDVKNNSSVISILKDLSSGLRDLSEDVKSGYMDEKTLMWKLEINISHMEKLSRLVSQFDSSVSLHKLSFASSGCKFPESVRDLPMDTSSRSNEELGAAEGRDWLKSKFFNEENSKDNDSCLVRYFSKAQEKSFHRTTFYTKTPNKSTRVPEQEMFNISDILETLTGLDNTFISDDVGALCSDPIRDIETDNVTRSKTSLSSTALLSTLVSDITKINSLERLNDIQRVDDKLRELKSNS